MKMPRLLIVLLFIQLQAVELREITEFTSCSSYTASYRTWDCGDHQHCIPSTHVCDGYNDCLDGSDELNCVVCRGESFSCGNRPKQCVAKQFYCDGIKDCKDGSDEPNTCILARAADAFDIVDPKNAYGPVFGGIVGIILLVFTSFFFVIMTIFVCFTNKNCPIYKWRKRREQPSVGVIIAANDDIPNEATLHHNHEPEDNELEVTDTTTDRRSLITP